MGWGVQRIESTEFFLRRGQGEEEEEVWEAVVGEPSAKIVRTFLAIENHVGMEYYRENYVEEEED